MEAEVQKFETQVQVDENGKVVGESSNRAVGPIKKFEFGAPDDNISAAVGGGYVAEWKPDFLQKSSFGREVSYGRFYFDKRVAVDVLDPNSKTARRKKRLCFENGFGYLCIPENFPQDTVKLKKLYEVCLSEYRRYEEENPRPVQYQDALVIDESGNPKRVQVTARDVKVGGGTTVSVKQQEAEISAAKAATKSELKSLENRSKLLQAIRKSREAGQPFRNPYIAKGKRAYQIEYA